MQGRIHTVRHTGSFCGIQKMGSHCACRRQSIQGAVVSRAAVIVAIGAAPD